MAATLLNRRRCGVVRRCRLSMALGAFIAGLLLARPSTGAPSKRSSNPSRAAAGRVFFSVGMHMSSPNLGAAAGDGGRRRGTGGPPRWFDRTALPRVGPPWGRTFESACCWAGRRVRLSVSAWRAPQTLSVGGRATVLAVGLAHHGVFCRCLQPRSPASPPALDRHLRSRWRRSAAGRPCRACPRRRSRPRRQLVATCSITTSPYLHRSDPILVSRWRNAAGRSTTGRQHRLSSNAAASASAGVILTSTITKTVEEIVRTRGHAADVLLVAAREMPSIPSSL